MVIASGGSNGDAGRAAKVTSRTIQRWRNDEVQFADAVDDFRSEFLNEAAGLLAHNATAAARKLGELIESGEERHQLTASRLVLELASRYRNDQTLESRINALELAAGLRRPIPPTFNQRETP
jgi:hypothetical protein